MGSCITLQQIYLANFAYFWIWRSAHTLNRYDTQYRPITSLWRKLWVNEKGHEPSKNHRGSGSKNESADPWGMHSPDITWYERYYIVRTPTKSHNAAIAITPVVEAAKLQQTCSNDPNRIERCYQLA